MRVPVTSRLFVYKKNLLVTGGLGVIFIADFGCRILINFFVKKLIFFLLKILVVTRGRGY